MVKSARRKERKKEAKKEIKEDICIKEEKRRKGGSVAAVSVMCGG
jgi:hypothetical protein